jgi:conjugal transfer pilus assembly protein TraB
MSKSPREYFESWKAKCEETTIFAKTWWSNAGTNHRRIAVMAAVVIGMCCVYALSKGEEGTKSKVMTSREAEFKKARILGDPYASSSRAKEQILSRTAKEYSDSQKALIDSLAQVNSRIDAIQGKIDATKGNVQGAGAAVNTPSNSAVEPSAGSTGQGVSPVTAPTSSDTPVAREPIDMRPNIPRGIGGQSAYGSSLGGERSFNAPKGPPVISFPVQGAVMRERAEVVLPVGSYVKAKLLTGVEAPEGNPYPVLMQLDFANILPNKKSLDLRGCFMIAKAQGDLSTERVQMQATKLSCVSRSGQMFERDINGFVADAADNSFAVIGTVNTKQDRVAAMAFLSSIVQGVGQAIQMAQTSEQTSPEGTSRRTLTGDQGKYIAAGGASTAAGMVAQWYLKQAQSLLPTINVGSGQDIWVVMNETVALPQEYFKKVSKGESHGKDYSLVNRLFD